MQRYFYALLVNWLALLSGCSARAQSVRCATPSPSAAYKQQLLTAEQQLALRLKTARPARTTTTVSVRVNMVRRSDGSGALLTDEQLATALTRLNRAFADANLQFRQYGPTHYVDNDRYARLLDAESLAAMRQQHDVNEAINLYLVPYSALYSGSSFAFLPAPGAAANLVYIANVAPSDLLYDYVIPHEMGHYFGLLHTFEGNDPLSTGRRELVTRGPGANCATHGDLICDTPADPHGLADDCRTTFDPAEKHCTLACDLTDPNGDRYQPDLRNTMSYYTACGDWAFTAGQRARMQVGLQIRTELNCESIVAEPVRPRIYARSIELPMLDGYVGDKRGCAGTLTTVTFDTTGSFPPATPFRVQLLNAPTDVTLAEVLADVPAVPVPGAPGKLQFTLPVDQSFPDWVRYRLVTTDPAVTGCLGPERLSIVAAPAVRLGFETTASDSLWAEFGQMVPVQLRLDNNALMLAASLRVNDNVVVLPATEPGESLLTLNQPFYQTTTIRVDSVRPVCGGVRPGSARTLTVVVRPPTLKVEQPTALTACAGTTFNVAYSSTVAGNMFNVYHEIELSDETGRFADDSTRSIGFSRTPPIRVTLPTTLPAGTNYRMRVVIRVGGVKLTGEPGAPFAIGRAPGATLQAEQPVILRNDTTALTVTLTGLGPWTIALSDGRTFTTGQPTLRIPVRPTETTTYRLTSVKNGCGTTTATTPTQVRVQAPLAIVPAEMSVLIAPNPVQQTLTIRFTTPSAAAPPGGTQFSICNALGQSLRQWEGPAVTQDLDVSMLPAGLYQLLVSDAASRRVIRFLKTN